MHLQRYVTVFWLMVVIGTVSVHAQQKQMTGRVIDKETREPLEKTTLQLYRVGKKDTTFVSGCSRVPAPPASIIPFIILSLFIHFPIILLVIAGCDVLHPIQMI